MDGGGQGCAYWVGFCRCPGTIRRSRRKTATVRARTVQDEQSDGVASTAETAGSRRGIASGAWRARGLDSRSLVVLRVDDVVGRILLEARGCALIPGRANRKEAAVYDAGLCKRRSLPECRRLGAQPATPPFVPSASLRPSCSGYDPLLRTSTSPGPDGVRNFGVYMLFRATQAALWFPRRRRLQAWAAVL